MNMPKSRDIQAKIPLPQAIWNEFWLSYCEISSYKYFSYYIWFWNLWKAKRIEIHKNDSFYKKNTIKIWLSAKTQYLSAFSRKQIHQFTTYLLPLNEPWYASFPRYAKIWYSTSVLKQEKNWIFYRLWNT